MPSASALAGLTVRWRFDEGPTAGSTYEHTFHDDGSVEFRRVDGSRESTPTREKRYGAFEVAPDVQLVSYLGASGYTLTVAMNLASGRLFGFASNEKEWYPVSGAVESA